MVFQIEEREGDFFSFIVQLLSLVCSLGSHGLQHARPPGPSSTPRVYPNSCPLSWWCHPTISSSVDPFSSCLQSFPASGSFLMSQFFASGGQSIGVSASTTVLPMNIQHWFSLEWTGWISLHHHLYATIVFPARCWKYYKPSRHDPCLQNNLTAWIKKEKKKKIEPQRNEAVCHLFQTKVRKFTKLPFNYLNIMSFTKKRQTFLC